MAATLAYSLPLLLAIDKGYFDRAGLDVQVVPIQGSATAVLPQLSQGQVDLLQAVPAPNLFNQAAQGFNVKIVAGVDVNKAGRTTAAYLVLTKNQANIIKTLQDLKGKSIEAAVQGSPISLTVDSALQQAGLVAGQDVTVTYRVRTPADFLSLIQNHAADVIGTTSVAATQAEHDGDAVKWKDTAELAPWYQATVFAASNQALTTNRPAVEKFTEVYLQAAREVNTSNAVWTDELVTMFSKDAGIAAQVVKDQGGVPYFDPNGSVSLDSLTRTQDFFSIEGQIPQKIDPQILVDPSVAEDAVKAIGRMP